MKKFTIENMKVDDLMSKVNIQSHIQNLLSDKKEDVRTALLTIAYAAQ